MSETWGHDFEASVWSLAFYFLAVPQLCASWLPGTFLFCHHVSALEPASQITEEKYEKLSDVTHGNKPE